MIPCLSGSISLDDDRSIGRIFMRSKRGEKLAANVFSSGLVLDQGIWVGSKLC